MKNAVKTQLLKALTEIESIEDIKDRAELRIKFASACADVSLIVKDLNLSEAEETKPATTKKSKTTKSKATKKAEDKKVEPAAEEVKVEKNEPVQETLDTVENIAVEKDPTTLEDTGLEVEDVVNTDDVPNTTEVIVDDQNKTAEYVREIDPTGLENDGALELLRSREDIQDIYFKYRNARNSNRETFESAYYIANNPAARPTIDELSKAGIEDCYEKVKLTCYIGKYGYDKINEIFAIWRNDKSVDLMRNINNDNIGNFLEFMNKPASK